ncbi:MAG: hypothetical protein R3308_08690 [Thiohalobacterales bacterium]|nr:hypothetical protein [Thiohalobacterales bacterium]
MNRKLPVIAITLLLSCTARAEEYITREQIEQVIAATDAAALQRDAAAVGVYLAEDFERIIEFAHKYWMAKVKLAKYDYLMMIDEGWAGIADYDYRRDDIEIHIMPDGLSGRSFSTLTEHMIIDGIEMTSRFREHATYAMEDGRPVIIEVNGHTLLGDTTPQ